MEKKKSLIDIAIVSILYLAIVTFPIDHWIKDTKVYYGTMVAILALYVAFLFIYYLLHRYMVPKRQKLNVGYLLILLPTFFATISNLFYAWFIGEKMVVYFPSWSVEQVLFLVLTALIEEIIFRNLILSNLKDKGAVKAILYSSGLFALFHLSHYFATFDAMELLKVAYTFGIGVVLGAIYYYSNLLSVAILFHIAFNVVNDFLFTSLYNVNHEFAYYFTNGLVALIVGVYLILIYLFVLKKKEEQAQ